MGLKGLLLDLDGTLIHFQIDYLQCRTQTIQILEENGYPKSQLTHETFVLRMLELGTQYFYDVLHYSDEKIAAIRKKVDHQIAQVEAQAAKKAQRIPDMIKILEFAASHDLKTGIITLNTSDNAQLSLKQAQLISYFPNPEFIVGRDRTTKIKPDPQHAVSLLERMHLLPEDVCLIGDHPSDIETANRIGARSIAVTSEKHPKEEFDTPYFIKQTNPYPKVIKILKQFVENEE